MGSQTRVESDGSGPGDEAKILELLAEFTPAEALALLGRAADIKHLGPEAWSGFNDVVDALYWTATAQRRR